MLKSVKSFFQRCKQADILTNSAALAYHTLLAIVPLMGLIFLYLQQIGIPKRWFNLTRSFLVSQVSVGSENIIIKYFDRLTAPIQSNTLGWIGLAVVFYTAWNLIDKFGDGLDKVLDTSPDRHHIEKRNFFKLMIRRLLGMMILPIGIPLSLLVSHWIRKDSWLSFIFGIQTIGHLITFPMVWIAHVFVFSLIYYFFSRSRVHRSQALKAGMIIGPAFEVIKYFFVWGSHYTVILNKIYGILIVIPLFILWVQIAWMIILSGGIFIHFTPSKNRVA